ncbi:MAG TPA: chemotaxis protein CheW [Haliangium sp.]|nr:chemotaxis protein CheW [Haliangium sp.]
MIDGHRSANQELVALVASRAGATEGEADGRTEAAARQAGNTLPFLLLRLGNRWFGLRAESVREVVGHEVVNRVPGQPAHVRGVAIIHGRMVPVVALDVLLRAHVPSFSDIREAGRDGGDGTRARLVVLAGEQLEIAIPADDARGVMHLLAAFDAPGDAGRLRFVLGEIPWNEQLVCVLDGAALLAAALAPGPA